MSFRPAGTEVPARPEQEFQRGRNKSSGGKRRNANPFANKAMNASSFPYRQPGISKNTLYQQQPLRIESKSQKRLIFRDPPCRYFGIRSLKN